MEAATRQSSNATSDPSILSFALLAFASVCWVVLVGLLLPRLLGHVLAFLANRASRGAFHVVIPTLHIYPLAGRAVVHSLRYTVPDGTISVEELVLQIRWWRKAHESQFRQLLAVDDAHTLDPVAHAQEQLARENSAFLLKRFWYRLRRWWRRSAGPTDGKSPSEPPPLISLIAVGLRARLVNVKGNYHTVNRVLDLAKAASRRKHTRATSDMDATFDLPLQDMTQSFVPNNSESSTSSYTSEQSADAKPFRQRIAELVSLRITSGAFYFCDMGESPLIRLVVDSAKVRYRYGAAACPIDECRKRFRVLLSGLCISVADRDTMRKIVEPASKSEPPSCDLPVDNTNRLIQRVMEMGYQGMSDPFVEQKQIKRTLSSRKRPRALSLSSEEGESLPDDSGERRPSFRYRNRSQAREARRIQALPCLDLLTSETAVIDYVFDEPGPITSMSLRETSPGQFGHFDAVSEGNTEDTNVYPAPVCRLSILLRGATCSYDMKAVADIERVTERLQPAFYDLMPLATMFQSQDGKRSATGLQIEIDATPTAPLPSRSGNTASNKPFISIPFEPREKTWIALSSLDVRKWQKGGGKDSPRALTSAETSLPSSTIDIHAEHISIRTEIPYRTGALQKTNMSLSTVNVLVTGVVEMPLCHATDIKISRAMQFPQKWNEVHSSSVDIILKDSQIIYLPDTVRVIDDLNTYMRENMKKPADVRFFVPFKETTRIQAESKYSVVLSCSHENAWEDIYSLEADQYGKMTVCGDTGELVLTPGVPTEFQADSSILSWTLSLPNATGQLELPFPHKLAADQTGPPWDSHARPSDSDRSVHQKGRAPSLARRVRSQLETFASHLHRADIKSVKPRERTQILDIVQAGDIFKLTGKVLVNEERKFLSTSLPSFLDALDRSDVNLKVSTLAVDVNPHHITHYLNVARNYTGAGMHVISTMERNRLHSKRNDVAHVVLNERRYPFMKECIILGLGAGQTLSSIEHRNAMDELLCVTFHVDCLLVRLHDLPHALSPFNSRSKDVCSLESGRFLGSLRATRLGLELVCSPEAKDKSVTVFCQHRDANAAEGSSQLGSRSGNLTAPTIIVEQFEVRKRTVSSPEWGPYKSQLTIGIGRLTGCLLDSDILCLSRIGLSTVPDPLLEDQLAAVSLLSIENIEVVLGKADVLVLSTSSHASAKRSGQVRKLSLLQQKRTRNQAGSEPLAPTFLTGVTQVGVPFGLRFFMSNLSSKTVAVQSRLLIPNISLDLLMSWGGKLTPWVDEATLRAQVAHAVLVKDGSPQGTFQDGGFMRRAAELRETTLELVFDFRPRVWSQTVAELQRHHICQQNENTRGQTPNWYSSTNFAIENFSAEPDTQELEQKWWVYLQRSRRATILKRHLREQDSGHGRLDSVSIGIFSDASIMFSPESLELANDVVIRYKEDLWGQESAILLQERHASPGSGKVSTTELTEMWHIYEAARPPRWSLADEVKPGELLRAVETKGLRVLFLSPVLPGEAPSSEPFFHAGPRGDDLVYLSAPFGVHLLDIGKTELPMSESIGQVIPSHVHHTRVGHVSVPGLAVGCNTETLCDIAGIVLIMREQTKIQWINETEPIPETSSRDDKYVLVAKISSIHVGKENSRLQQYACFGRIVSIFTLMSRALALENASLAAIKNARIEELTTLIMPISIIELMSMRPGYVRTFFSDASRRLLDQEAAFEERERGVAFVNDLPQFLKEEASTVDGEHVKYGVVTSIDVAIQEASLRLTNEEIIRADTLVCKGGSTAKAQMAAVLEGHVLSASFGTLSVAVRDDIAANTLRMVSEVASFVRRATISMPMLRYGGESSERDELMSYSYMNEELLKASVANSLEQATTGADHRRRIHFPLRSPSSSRKSRGHWYNFANTRIRIPAQTRSLGTYSQGASPRDIDVALPKLEHFDPNPHTLPAGPLFGLGDDIPSETQSKIAEEPDDQQTHHTVRSKTVTFEKRRERPASCEGQQFSIGTKGWFNREGAFEEDNQYFAHVAIPTAVDTGPPRKRSKVRVRLSPAVPPSFSDAHLLSLPRGTERRVRTPITTHRTDPLTTGNHQTSANLKISREKQIRSVPSVSLRKLKSEEGNSSTTRAEVLRPKRRAPLTLFVSCREIITRYFRQKSLPDSISCDSKREADICFALCEPRLTLMSEPPKGSHSLVVTVSSARLKSTNNPNCELTGSIASVGITVSIAQGFVPLSIPKLIASARISEFQTTLHATDLKSVLMFREEFKSDLKAVLSAFVTMKSSVSEMARATRLSSSKMHYPVRKIYSTMAFDLLCENSRVKLEGFHPRDGAMCISYLLDGLFFSVVASEADKAALTLGLRLYGHGLSLSSPSWPSDEVFHFPSFDARGVQWGETTGLPTLIKVSAEPLINRTSVQGLRHVLFTVAGLMAFQHTAVDLPDMNDPFHTSITRPKNVDSKDAPADAETQSQPGATPFTRSVTAWERTKGVRMDLSIRPMSISLESGEVAARFDVEAITGIFEWNKLVRSGVQLRAGISIPKISLVFMRRPISEMTADSDKNRASLSVSLEKSRLDILKTQEDLTHTFIFRLDIFAVSGQLRPWKLLLDAATWADEQEFVSDLQAINTAALSSSKPRTPKSPKVIEPAKLLQHRIILIGTNVQRFKLAIPLLSSEQYSSSRLALRATELHFHARQRFEGEEGPRKNIFEVKSHFIGILWENTALLSSHHSRISLRLEPPSVQSTAHFGLVQIIVVAGTWRICPRKDVVMAILEAKNGRENKQLAERPLDFFGSLPEVLSKASSSVAGDSFSNTTERQGNRLLVESLQLKILRTSGFIEGLEGGNPAGNSIGASAAGTNLNTFENSKLTVPAFSVAMVREEHETFDLIDVDFSGREGEFPPQCLQKVANLLAEVFGAVASDQANIVQDISVNAPNQPREISRDTSILIRFGKSLYRAQEEAGTSVESKISFFAGRTSSILASLTTAPIFGQETGHTTVINGISPKLALEVTPLIDGTKVQSLRLINARVQHSISPCRPPHTLLHIARVTALMDARTLLLTQGRLKAMKLLKETGQENDNRLKSAEVRADGEQNVMVVLGRSGIAVKAEGTEARAVPREQRIEPDIRLQLKLPPKNESPNDQVDIFAERLHVGVCKTRKDPYAHAVPVSVHVALHDMNLRGQWDIVDCKLRLRENLFSCVLSGISPKDGGSTVVTNVMNRLHFESTQYGNHTMKLNIDAVAALCAVPSRSVLLESTTINTEFSHTMVKSVVRLTGQWKKLTGEVKLLVEREVSKGTKRKGLPLLYSDDRRSEDSLVVQEDTPMSREGLSQVNDYTSGSTSSSPNEVVVGDKTLKRSGKKTKIYIRGDGFSAVLRGYQFEETQHSAMVMFTTYNMSYEYNCILSKNCVHIKELGIDFKTMKMSYNDDERSIHSDLFKVPSPKLKLKIIDTDKELTVELLGDLEVKLGPGFFLWSDFKKLSELTINGITPAQDPEEDVAEPPMPDRPEVWDGRVAQVSVRLNPRIDVIGDLTSDMLQFVNSKRDHVTIVPKALYDNVVVHIEACSEALCDPLCR